MSESERVSNDRAGITEGIIGGEGKDENGAGKVVPEVELKGPEVRSKVSFRDKVLGGSVLPQSSLPQDFVQHNLVKIECQNGDRLCPRVMFD